MARRLGKKGLNFPEHKERNIKKKNEGIKRRTTKLLSGKLIIPFLVHLIFFTFSCSLSFSFIVYTPHNVHRCLYTGFIAKVLSYDRFPILSHRSSTFLLSYQPLPPPLLTITPTHHSRSLHSSITSLIFPVGFFPFLFCTLFYFSLISFSITNEAHPIHC
jgi:hypothetical protein